MVSMRFQGPLTAGVVFSGVLFVLKLPIIFWQIIGILATGLVIFAALRAFGLPIAPSRFGSMSCRRRMSIPPSA
jgi:hypothetical protein